MCCCYIIFVKKYFMDLPHSELDNFLIRNNQQPTPKRSYVNHNNNKPHHHQLHRNHHALK